MLNLIFNLERDAVSDWMNYYTKIHPLPQTGDFSYLLEKGPFKKCGKERKWWYPEFSPFLKMFPIP